MSGPIVICGARGFVGSHLLPHLVARGLDVRAGSRSPDRATAMAGVEWVELDVDRPETLEAAFQGADAVIYLVHQLRADTTDLHGLEASGARNVLDAADRAGVRRLVYLGAAVPAGPPSPHLAARHRTGEILRSGKVSTVELRAGMVVGAGSESWLIVRDLALRLPVMVLPSWLKYRTQPIGIDDVVQAMSTAIDLPLEGSAPFDLPGPEALTGQEVLVRIAKQAGMRPLMIPVPVLTPSLSSHWLRLVTRANYTIARQLVDGLTSDLVAPDDGYWNQVSVTRTPFDEAVARALAEDDPIAMSGFGRGLERVVRSVARRG